MNTYASVTVASAEAARAEGISIREWARRLGLTEGVVAGRLSRLGVRWSKTVQKCVAGHPRAGNSSLRNGVLRCNVCDAARGVS